MSSTLLYWVIAFTPPETWVLRCDLHLQAVISEPGGRALAPGVWNEWQWQAVGATTAKSCALPPASGQLRTQHWINLGLLLLIHILGACGNVNGGLGPRYSNCWIESVIFWKRLLAELPFSFTCPLIKIQLGTVLRNNCHFHVVPVM